MDEKIKLKVKELPRVPGVYMFKDLRGKVIYVGKAKNLYNRVSSYFNIKFDPTSKTHSLVNRITGIDHIEALSEFEALILEAELIKKYNPKYNISLKDDKSFIYIVIRKETFKLEGKRRIISKVLTARRTDILDNDVVFGPYTDGSTAKQIVRIIRKLFPYRDCSVSKFNKYKKLSNPCLYGHIGLCNGPCASYEDTNLSEYRKNISRIKKLLSGKSVKIIKNIESSMQKASKSKEYEEAAKYRDLLEKFNYIRQEFTEPEDYIKNPYLAQDRYEKALFELKESLPLLTDLPKRIECYDISNISGKDAVGSMVVSINGRIDNSEYRKFKIKFKKTPDDYEMMKEVLLRRVKREVSKNKKVVKWGVPDLIVVDGGKGQVTAALEALQTFDFPVPVIGIAKKYETFVFNYRGKFVEKNLSRDNKGLHLVMNLRDEAHRFAQRYHHQLRLRKISGKKR
jgi:excinuclease ABC subunit C